MQTLSLLLRRYLWPREGNLISYALWLSVLGVALGITLLMVTLGVMSGFQHFLKDSFTRMTSEIVVIPRGEGNSAEWVKGQLSQNKAIEAVTPVLMGQGMVIKEGAVGGVLLEGIDLSTSSAVTPWEKVWLEAPLFDTTTAGTPWIWLGVHLAKKLKASVGDTVELLLVSGEDRRVIPFQVMGITKFGIYDRDLRQAVIDIGEFKKLFPESAENTLYKTKLAPGMDLDKTVESLKESLGKRANVRRWNDINHNIFLAVEHQKKMLFVVLEILVGLAAMNVVNLLMMSVYFRRRDTAILRAMGMTRTSVLLFFVIQGGVVGVMGIGVGVGLGLAVAFVMQRWQPVQISEAVYNVTRLPVVIELNEVAIIAMVAVVVCLIFSLFPAWRAQTNEPSEALRYE